MNNEIKMKDVLSQLEHKKRTIKDLAQFVENKCDDNPNYTLLLGSGCSVTSGVNTGQKLINTWKKEIYEAEHKNSESVEEFWNRQYSWFDERNSYSSLFEKKYDLPRQRRIFVEREIEGKNPSIGYAYLVKLIEKHNINTVFTTNFDDLLNEAFYRYSNVRPIVCAHDSSISSITVTSKRPKIIKLHGDYLFDDIKSTLRETESLNDNMKNKFIEFAKDHGLIVVGYAGNDRSIMDILNMLLQKEDYFKYGIYWCIRKGENDVSEELRKLLWKDRVYFVEIDGFDELMAALNDSLNNGELPIDDELLSSKRQKSLIKDMINSKYFDEKTNSDVIISRDIKKLDLMVKRHIIDDVFDVLNNSTSNDDSPNKKYPLRSLSSDEKAKLNVIHHMILDNELDKALEVIVKEQVNDTSVFNFNLLSYKVDLLLKQGVEEAIDEIDTLFDQLILLNPERKLTYLEAYSKLGENTKALKFLNAAIDKYPNDYNLYNKKIMYIYRNQIDAVLSVDDPLFKELKDCIDKSIELFDSSNNEAWIHLCHYYTLYYYNDNDKKKENIKKIVNQYSKVTTSNLARAYQRYYKELDLTVDDCISRLKALKEFADKADDWGFYEEVISVMIDVYESKDDKKAMLDLMKQYEAKFSPSENFLFMKANWLINTLGQYKEACQLIKKNMFRSIKWKVILFNYYCDVREEDKAFDMLNKYFKNDVEKQLIFYSSFNKDDRVIEVVDEYARKRNLNLRFISSKACSLFRLQQYDKAYTFCKKYFELPYMQQEGVICINYYLAYFFAKGNKDLKDKISKKMINSSNYYTDAELAAAYALLDDKNNCFVKLRKVVEKRPLMRFDIKDWPVFDKYKNEPTFLQIVNTDELTFVEETD